MTVEFAAGTTIEEMDPMHAGQVELPPGAATEGLSESEVRERRERYGYNELPEKKENPLLKFLTYFWGPIPWMIEAAMVLSAIVKDWTDLVHHCAVAGGQRGGWRVGGISGRQCDRGAQGPAGPEGARQASGPVAGGRRAGAGAR